MFLLFQLEINRGFWCVLRSSGHVWASDCEVHHDYLIDGASDCEVLFCVSYQIVKFIIKCFLRQWGATECIIIIIITIIVIITIIITIIIIIIIMIFFIIIIIIIIIIAEYLWSNAIQISNVDLDLAVYWIMTKSSICVFKGMKHHTHCAAITVEYPETRINLSTFPCPIWSNPSNTLKLHIAVMGTMGKILRISVRYPQSLDSLWQRYDIIVP